MGIRSKVLVAFLLCFGLVGWASLVLLQQRMNAEFETLERVEMVESMGRVRKVMNASVLSLKSQTRDWSEWTDMYEYFRRPTAAQVWADRIINVTALDTADVSFVDLLDAQGNTRRRVQVPVAMEEVELPQSLRQSLVHALSQPGAMARCGLLPTSGRLALVCAGRVTRSDRTGQFLGIVLMGRLLNDQRVTQWQEQTGFGLRLLGEGEFPPDAQWWKDAASEHQLGPRDMAVRTLAQLNVLYAPLTDISGAPVASLEVRIPRELYVRTQALQLRITVQAILSALCIAVLLAAAVHWLLVRRLRSFKEQLQALASEGAWSRRIALKGTDELGVLASEVNLMLEMMEAQVKDLTAQSMTDTLTALPNRRAFDMRLALEFGRARRQGQMLSLLAIDVDYFKRFNDRYGHLAGDAALRVVAEVLGAACTRAMDMAARLGGEEFAVLLPITPAEGAVDIAQRIQSLLASRAVLHEDSDAANHLTLSIGIATLHGLDESAHALLARADRALYAAKAQGRNRHTLDLLPGQTKLKEAA
jgi:diguanylate cyclase (GGDEF)-like protein